MSTYLTAYEKYLSYEKSLDDDEQEHRKESEDSETRNMNYHVLVIFHLDSESRPCRPVIRAITLPEEPQNNRSDIIANPRGVSMVRSCQLCDTSSRSYSNLTVDKMKIHSVYDLAITDKEAKYVLSTVEEINKVMSHIWLENRSNFTFLPKALHHVFPANIRSILHLRIASSVTDVQLAILLLRESLNPGRAIIVKLQTMHPYMSTPDNLHEAIALFARKLDTLCFKTDKFRFAVL